MDKKETIANLWKQGLGIEDITVETGFSEMEVTACLNEMGLYSETYSNKEDF